MTFELRKSTEVVTRYDREPYVYTRRWEETIETWTWALRSKDATIALCPMGYKTEADARANIAAAKKAMAGARYAKVKVVE